VCLWGRTGIKGEIDPDAFQIVDGRLLLQYSKGVKKKFNKDAQGNLKKADQKWPEVSKKQTLRRGSYSPSTPAWKIAIEEFFPSETQ
jgi:hypothetical protein